MLSPPPSVPLSRRRLLRAGGGLIGSALTPFGAAGAAGAAEASFIALVHTQAAGDHGPIDDMIAKINHLSQQMAVPARIVYADNPRRYAAVLTGLARAGARVIVATFPPMTAPIRAVAPRFPQTKFIQIYGTAFTPQIPNVRTIGYESYQGMFLAGFFAAQVSRAGKLGYIGGVDEAGGRADLNALRAGARLFSKTITLRGAFAGSYEDPARGRMIAQRQYAEGIDFIQTDGAATDIGVIEAANSAPNRIVSGVFRSQFRLGEQTMASAVLVYFGQSLATQVSVALIGQFLPGHYVSSLSDGIVDFVPSFLFMQAGPEPYVVAARRAWQLVQAAKVAIIDGKIKVPFNTRR